MKPRLPSLAIVIAAALAGGGFAVSGAESASPAKEPAAAKRSGEAEAKKLAGAAPDMSPAKIRERQDKAFELAKGQLASVKKAREILERKPKRTEFEESELQALSLAQQFYTGFMDRLQAQRDMETLQAGGEAGARARRPAKEKESGKPTAEEEARENEAAARDSLAKLKELNDKYWAAAKSQEQAAGKYLALRGEELPDPMLWLLNKESESRPGKAEGKTESKAASGARAEPAP